MPTRHGADAAPEDATPQPAAKRPRHRFRLKADAGEDMLVRLLTPFADLGFGPSSLLAVRTDEGPLLVVAEFDGLSEVRAKVLTRWLTRTPGVHACHVATLDD